MAQDTRNVGKMVNQIVFDVDLSSYRKASKAIDNVKKRLKGLKDATGGSFKLSVRETQASIKRAKQVTQKVHDHKLKANKTLLADMLRQEEKMAKATAKREERVGIKSERFNTLLGQSGLRRNQMSGFKRDLDTLNRSFLSGAMSVAQYNGRVSNLTSQMRHASNATRSMTDQFKNLRSALIGVTASYTAFSAGIQVTETAKRFEALEIGMEAAFGKQAADSMKFLRMEADRLGFDMLGVSKDYVKFSAAASVSTNTLEEQREVFSNLMEAGRVFGLSTDQNALVMKAVTQMYS